MRLTSPADIAALIRGRRKALGLSQGEIALRAGVSRRWLVGFEAGGSSHAEVGTILRVLDALDLVLDAQPHAAVEAGTVPSATTGVPDSDAVDLDALLDALRRG